MASRLTQGSFAIVSAGVVSLALVAGCDSPGINKKVSSPSSSASGSAAKGAVSQTTTTGASLGAGAGSRGPTVDTVGLSVSSEIARACGITARGESKAAASFEFDSAALAAEDRTMLGEVAKCLTDGALRGRTVALVGRTDPRGEPEYNMGLGGSRSEAVNRYMIDLGVGRERLTATSRGELDATGHDESGWAQDRRVDIELVKK
ncbi:MAG: peptidoglycan-associated outer rane lipoprotein [Labilithrix sp.]|nr:peptidoglycan-associated outer rane lipoprotein [Labilithrix sp.]